MSQGSPPAPRTAREVIDVAIGENKAWDWLCWLLVILFPLAGVGVLIFGAVRGEGLVSLSGAIASALFWPALRYAITIRKANLEVRMLELTVSRATDPKEIAKAIRDVFRGKAN